MIRTMNRTIDSAIALFLVSLACLTPLPASGLIQISRGNHPVPDPGWPEGALAMANFESRIGWWEGPPFGGGESHFLFCGNTEGFEDALAVFAAIRAPALDLIVHDGPEQDGILKERVDWAFTIWVPANWHRLYNNPKLVFNANDPHFRQPMDPPRLDVYIGGGQVDWARIKVPANLRVRDERASASASAIDLSGGSVIQANCYDMDTGKPIPGAHLVVEKVAWQTAPNPHWEHERVAEAVSDADGQARIKNVPNEGTRVSVAAAGYVPRRLSDRARGHPELLKFTVELARTASIRGSVTDTRGQPIKGAKVRTSTEIASNGLGYNDGRHYEPPDDWSVVTDEAGRFELKGLPVGYAQLFVTAAGYCFRDSLTIHDVPATNVVLQLARAGAIHVTVTDQQGKPLSRYEGHEILIQVEPRGGSTPGSWGGGAPAKADGTHDFSDVPSGEYRLTARPNPTNSNQQFAPEQVVTVTPGGRATVKVVHE